jgi:hypothetical protein
MSTETPDIPRLSQHDRERVVFIVATRGLLSEENLPSLGLMV